MGRLEKTKTVFMRDEAGQLVPQEAELMLPDKPAILITPLLKGELQKYAAVAKTAMKNKDSDKDVDADIIVKHCIEPKYTEAEAKDMKPEFSSAITVAILSLTIGKSQDEVKTLIEKTGKAEVLGDEDFLSPKS